MRLEDPAQRIAAVDGEAGGDALIRERLSPQAERQTVLERLQPLPDVARADGDARAACGHAADLELEQHALERGDPITVRRLDYAVRVEHEHRRDLGRQPREELSDGSGLVAIDFAADAAHACPFEAIG